MAKAWLETLPNFDFFWSFACRQLELRIMNRKRDGELRLYLRVVGAGHWRDNRTDLIGIPLFSLLLFIDPANNDKVETLFQKPKIPDM